MKNHPQADGSLQKKGNSFTVFEGVLLTEKKAIDDQLMLVKCTQTTLLGDQVLAVVGVLQHRIFASIEYFKYSHHTQRNASIKRDVVLQA